MLAGEHVLVVCKMFPQQSIDGRQCGWQPDFEVPLVNQFPYRFQCGLIDELIPRSGTAFALTVLAGCTRITPACTLIR
jgi:hypothetical protein